MQITEVLVGSHLDLANKLNVIAATASIQNVQKTVSSGKFLVVYDNSGSTGQTAEVIVGDPDTLADSLQTIIDGGGSIGLVANTFSAAHYVAVWA